MKLLKTIIIPAIFLVSMILSISSCKKEKKPNPPVITNFELGYQNSKTAFPGGALHIEAEILAEGKINNILIEIHPEGNQVGNLVLAPVGEPWKFDSTYTGKYSGVKNTVFHEHIDVPATANTGRYHFHFIVTDMEGDQLTVEEELEVVLPTDTAAPVIQVTSVPDPGQPFTTGQTISISGLITDDIAIAGIYIALVAEDQNLPDSLVNHVNTISMLHTHDFHDPKSVPFEANLIVGAAYDNDHPDPKPINWQSGNYYILIKSPDAFGGNVGFSQYYPITISL